MIPVRCRTNLDLEQCEQWPEWLPTVPRVGDYIESGHQWKGRIRLRLVVVQVTYKYQPLPGNWIAEIEMGLPEKYSGITDFFEWYSRQTGKSVSSYL